MGSQPQRMDQTMPKKEHSWIFGFLERGTRIPATCPCQINEAGWVWQIKLRAGDVEKNPGPIGQGSICAICNKSINIGTTPLTCNKCGKVAHKTCSGLTRYHYEKVARGEKLGRAVKD